MRSKQNLEKSAQDILDCLDSWAPLTRKELQDELAMDVGRFRKAVAFLYEENKIKSRDELFKTPGANRYHWELVYYPVEAQWKPDYLDVIMERFEKSELPIKRFAINNGIPRTTFIVWMEIHQRRQHVE